MAHADVTREDREAVMLTEEERRFLATLVFHEQRRVKRKRAATTRKFGDEARLDTHDRKAGYLDALLERLST